MYGFSLFFHIILMVGGPDFHCQDLSSFETCATATSNGLITPADVLTYYHMNTASIGVCIGVLLLMYVVCFSLGYYFLLQKIDIWLH